MHELGGYEHARWILDGYVFNIISFTDRGPQENFKEKEYFNYT